MASSGNMAPSKQAKDVYAELALQVDLELGKLAVILDQGIKAFNKLIREKELPVVVLK
jgi:2-hydroxy-3-keto-5-methylthiopentenyl-1-phosphate phosphatase